MSEEAFVAGRSRGNEEGRLVGVIYEVPADGDEGNYDGDLDHHDDSVNGG